MNAKPAKPSPTPRESCQTDRLPVSPGRAAEREREKRPWRPPAIRTAGRLSESGSGAHSTTLGEGNYYHKRS